MIHALRRAAAHTLVPLGYLALAIAASWPLARDFATYVIGDVYYDERHAIWMLWYTAQALAGRVPWPDTTHLLWPHGISVLVDGVGPLNGLLALPFWPWGAAAAFNGVALLGLTLSGWSSYALAREVGIDRRAAFVAGGLYLLWPIHLIALTGHLEKLFVGLLPLALLAGLRAFDPARSRWWLAAPGVALLGTLLQNGNQFVFAVLGLALIATLIWLAAPRGERSARAARIALAGAASIAICAPLLWLIVEVMRDPALEVALGIHARYYSPDVLSLILPSPRQWWATWLFPADAPVRDSTWASTLPALNGTAQWYGTGLETAVAIPLTALALCAWGWRTRAVRLWIVFGLAFAVLSLGPRLRVAGTMTSVRLPYVALQRVPGLDVMRTPGRFMLLGSVGFAIGAGLGLDTLIRRRPRQARVIATAAAVLAAAECWPRPWPQTALPTVPEFYQRLAADRSGGAVLDLPEGVDRHTDRSSAYMYYQTIHGHPIAWAYLSRRHLRYPNAGLEGLWRDDAPAGPALRARLKALGYRYVVLHRYPALFLGGRVADGFLGQPFGPQRSPDDERLIREGFAGETPVHTDAQVMVWGVR